MRLAIFLALAQTVVASGCSAMSPAKPAQKLDVSTNYREDLEIRIGDLPFKGMAAVDQQGNYLINVSAREKADYMLVNTCHRELTVDPYKGSFFTVNFIPTPIERGTYCPINLTVISQKLWFQGATIVPNNAANALPAVLSCNGSVVKTGGMSVCQSKAGLIQQVKFDVPVEYGKNECPAARSLPDNVWEFSPKSGFCTYKFREISGSKREHVVTTYGYDQFIP